MGRQLLFGTSPTVTEWCGNKYSVPEEKEREYGYYVIGRLAGDHPPLGLAQKEPLVVGNSAEASEGHYYRDC